MIRIVMTFVLAAGAGLAQAQSANPAANNQSSANSSQAAPGPQAPGVVPSQAGQKPAAKPQELVDSVSTVGATQPVITVHGLCDTAQANASGAKGDVCTTVLTREQFDTLVNSLNSGNQAIPPAMRRKLAQAYVELLAFSDASQKAGIENTVSFKEVMRVVRMRTLRDLYEQSLQEKFHNVAQAEIENYYNQNAKKFEEEKLRRVFIPKSNPKAGDKAEFEKRAQEMANVVRERLARGEDPDGLEKEAYTTLALEAKPLSTDLGVRRRGMLTPTEEEEVFSLPPGSASKVEQEPAGFVIYKVESRQILPLDKVKDEISRELFRRKMEGENNRVMSSVHADYNEDYFGPAIVSPPPPVKNPPPK